MRCANKGCKHLRHGPTHPPFLVTYLIWKLKKKPEYGYLLAKHVQTFTMGYKKASTVYLILNKLEKCGLIKSKIEMKNSRSRRVYYTTKKGWSVFEKIRMKVINGELKEFINALVDK